MFDPIHVLAVELGPLADIVKYATYATLAASALFVLVRGRHRKWEPADTEVPRLAEKSALVGGAVITVIIFSLLNHRSFVPVLAIGAIVTFGFLFLAFFWFLTLSSHHLHDAPHLAKDGQHVRQRIIGDEKHLTPEARRQRTEGIPLDELIGGCGQKFDRVFDREWRGRMKVRFQVAYFFLVLCFVATLACTGQLLSLISHPTDPTVQAFSPLDGDQLFVDAQIKGQWGGTAKLRIWLEYQGQTLQVMEGTCEVPQAAQDNPDLRTHFVDSPIAISDFLRNQPGKHEVKFQVVNTPESGGKNWQVIVTLIRRPSAGGQTTVASATVEHNKPEEQKERVLTAISVAPN